MSGLAVGRSSTVQKMWTIRGLVILLLAGLAAARPQDDANKNNLDSENRIGFDIDEHFYPIPIPSPGLPGPYPIVNPIGEHCYGRDIWYQRNADGSCSICACVSRPLQQPSVSCLVCNAFCGGDWPSTGPAPFPSPLPIPYPNPFGPEPYPIPIGPEPYPVPFGPEPYPIPIGPEPYPVPFGPEPYPVPFGPEPYPIPIGPEPYPVPFGPGPYPVPFGPEPHPFPIGPEPYPVPFRPDQYPVPIGPEPYPLPIPLPEPLPYPLPSPIADYYCPPPPPPIIIPGPPRPVPVPVPVMVPGKNVYIRVPVPVQSRPEQINIPSHDIVPVDRPVPYPVLISVPVSNARVPVIHYISPVCRNNAPNVPFQSSEICVVLICRIKYQYVYLEKQRIPNCGLPWNGGHNGKKLVVLYKSGEDSEEDDSVGGASEPEERYALPSYGGNSLAQSILGGSSVLSSGDGYIKPDTVPNPFSGGYLGGPGSYLPSGLSSLSGGFNGGYSQPDALNKLLHGSYLGDGSSTSASILANALSGVYNSGYGQDDAFANVALNGGNAAPAQVLTQGLNGVYPSGNLNGGRILTGAYDGGYPGLYNGNSYVNGLEGGLPNWQGSLPNWQGGVPNWQGGVPNWQGGVPNWQGGLPNWQGGFPGGFPSYPSGFQHTDASPLGIAQSSLSQQGFGLRSPEKDLET